MSDYKDLVQSEARAFLEKHRQEFLDDEEEFGGKSEKPNFLRWIDRTGTLAARLQEVSKDWGTKEANWVQVNTRTKAQPGGDVKSNAFAYLLQDVRHAIKKLSR